MQRFKVVGGNRLCGEVRLPAAKNSVLPIIACSILCRGEVRLRGCAPFTDVVDMLEIVKAFGVKSKIEGSDLILDGREVREAQADRALTGKIRSSVFILGPLLGRLKRAKVAYPGGCDIGLRPIDLHIYGLKKLGVTTTEADGFIECDGTKLRGGEITFDFPSVGATENAMLAAVTAKGRTVIRNAAREPEIVDLASFVNACGGVVFGAGSDTIVVDGVERLHGCEFTPVPDRVIAGTFLTAAAITRGDVFLSDANADSMASVLDKLSDSGCDIYRSNGGVGLRTNKRAYAINKLETLPYPGFPTDMQAQFAALMTTAHGTTVVVENLFESRFAYTRELNKLGARVTVRDRVAVIRGVGKLRSSYVQARDLRGGAALVVAALAAEGETIISGIEHVDRGYYRLEDALNALGGNVNRENIVE